MLLGAWGGLLFLREESELEVSEVKGIHVNAILPSKGFCRNPRLCLIWHGPMTFSLLGVTYTKPLKPFLRLPSLLLEAADAAMLQCMQQENIVGQEIWKVRNSRRKCASLLLPTCLIEVLLPPCPVL